MATKQQASKETSGAARKPGQSSPPSGSVRQPSSQMQTGERDENYALISVLYHALQGAETIAMYIRDAQQAEDEELTEFFEETRQEYVDRAQQAKQLLASRLEEESEEMEEEEEEEEEDED